MTFSIKYFFSKCDQIRRLQRIWSHLLNKFLILFRMVGAKSPPPSATSFSSVTSTNVRISPQNFLTFSFNPFDRLVQNFKFVPSAGPKLLNLNQDHPSKKKQFFWSNPYKIEVIITSLIQMLELPNFGHMTKSTI